MKKIIVSTALVLISAFGFCQDSYTIKMNMKIEGLPPEYAAAAEQETTTFIKGEKTKIEVNGSMASQIIAYDGKTHYFVKDAMGNKTGYKATNEEMEAAKKGEKSEPKPKIEYTTEKKMIAGYECTKTIITSTDKDKHENKATVWVTDKIKSDVSKHNRGNKMLDLGDLKGYPLEMQMKQNNQGMDMTFTFTASDVSTAPLADSVFSVNTDGYTMSTYKDYREKMKGMGQ